MFKGRVCVAGGKGLVGTALIQRLKKGGYDFVASADYGIDLRDYMSTCEYFRKVKPDIVILVAAKHGGINEYKIKPVEYFKDNILICTNTISAAFDSGVKRLINIGASCVYGSDSEYVYSENDYDKEAVQKSTEPYGLAKLAGMKLCEYYNREFKTEYISLLPVNMYGNGNGYNIDYSSVIPSMVRRFHNAKVNNLDSVDVWGDGKNTREFLFVDDFIDAIEVVLRAENLTTYMFNVCGYESVTINKLASIIADIVGYTGEIFNDLSKSSGSKRGRLDSTKIRGLGWSPKTNIRDGLAQFYRNYTEILGGKIV